MHMQKNPSKRESRKRKFDQKMSEDNGSVAVVNVVKPTLNQSTASRNLDQVDHTTSTNSILLPPCTPPELLAALSKEREPFDQFSEAFGTVNKYGETILFELRVPVCNLYKDGSYERFRFQSNGKVTIIFRPEQRKVLVIVKRDDNFWESAWQELSGTTKFNVDGWAVKLFDNNSEGLCSETIHSDLGYIFEVRDSVSVRFSNEKELLRFKNVIRNVQVRISKNRLPTNDHLPKTGIAHLVSQFWFISQLRPCDLKLLFVNSALFWRIESSNPATSAHGIIAIVQYKLSKSLHLIKLTDTKWNYQLSEEFTLIASDISSDTNYFVWEWFINRNLRYACGFKTAKEASDFKVTTEYYLNAWKQGSLSWDW